MSACAKRLAMTVFLELGQRPDEPGPPIHGPATYPAEVVARLEADAKAIMPRYPQGRSALLPLLHLVQSQDGCLTPAGIAFCAAAAGSDRTPKSPRWRRSTRCTAARRPATTWSGCAPTPCARSWAATRFSKRCKTIWAYMPAQTTDDGRVTLEHVECNAACDYAPVVMVNWEFFDNQTPSSARDLVDGLRAGDPPIPTRGAPLCTFRETARILAGLPDPRPAAHPGQPGTPPSPGCGSPRSGTWRHRRPPQVRRRMPNPTTPKLQPKRRRTNPHPHPQPPFRPNRRRPKPTRTQRTPRHDATDSRAEPVLGRTRAVVA